VGSVLKGVVAAHSVAWAGQVTVRRLREDVGRAIALSETDHEVFRHSGGLPPESRDEPGNGSPEEDREIGASSTLQQGPALRDTREPEAVEDREIGARPTPQQDPAPRATRGSVAVEDREIGASPTPQQDPAPRTRGSRRGVHECRARLWDGGVRASWRRRSGGVSLDVGEGSAVAGRCGLLPRCHAGRSMTGVLELGRLRGAVGPRISRSRIGVRRSRSAGRAQR